MIETFATENGVSRPETVRSIKGRFVKHVFPGETLVTEMWRDGDRVIYATKVKERGDVAVSGGAVEFGQPPTDSSKKGSAGGELSQAVAALERSIKGLGGDEKKKLSSIDATFTFEIVEKPDASFSLCFKGTPSLIHGKADKSDITMTVSEEAFLQLLSGKTKAQQAFMSGKLKVKGNMMLAMKLEPVFSVLSGKKDSRI